MHLVRQNKNYTSLTHSVMFFYAMVLLRLNFITFCILKVSTHVASCEAIPFKFLLHYLAAAGGMRDKFYPKCYLDFIENTEVSISQYFFNSHLNLGLLLNPRKHNFLVRIY